VDRLSVSYQAATQDLAQFVAQSVAQPVPQPLAQAVTAGQRCRPTLRANAPGLDTVHTTLRRNSRYSLYTSTMMAASRIAKRTIPRDGDATTT
jgi:hypothetical protein